MKKELLTWLLAAPLSVFAQQHQETTLSDNWLFSQDKTEWKTVSVPHDWAIAGPFDKKWDLQKVAITQNGEKEATEKSGRSGALPWIGEGHYKRTIHIPKDCKHAELIFDGAMAEPTVYLNGEKAGYWAYGYNAFRVDITPYMKTGENLLEVDLQNIEESSRWYPGAGIYRPVKLLTSGKHWIDPWKTFIRTREIKDGNAIIDITLGAGSEPKKNQSFTVEICDATGKIVACDVCNKTTPQGEVNMSIAINEAKLWSPESPYLYTARISYTHKGKLLDAATQKFGIRTVKCSKDGGFQLNGVSRKIKGVCLHHDLGPLGAAVNKSALIRQIKMMKEMGCDAIRTSHNMPSQMQMELCDSLGMMVMAESFDMWKYPKCKNGYARFFDEWWAKDITNLVLANRNHPAIIMWSIGNEIPEQGNKVEGPKMAKALQDLCHQLDSTRPVTQGMDRVDEAVNYGFAAVMDVPGYNYRLPKYKLYYDKLPQGFLLGSETTSTVSSRGVYKFPVEIKDNSQYASWSPGYVPGAVLKEDGQCSSYDVEHCSWSNLPDDDWVMQDDLPWVIGEFVWTGYDYLGEPTPYDEYWPSRSSYFGICDLAGLPKDRYYLYRSRWNKQQHTIHLLPHWSFGKERIGQVTPVYCYTDYPTGELFINGKSQGRVTKNPAERLDRYRLRWNNTVYEPGEIKVVVYDAAGNKAGEQTIRTAGNPSQLALSTWTAGGNGLKATGDDLAFVTVSLTDANGVMLPEADDQLTFEVTGAGQFEAVCNGDATSLESFKQPTMKLFKGQLVVIVRGAKQPGVAKLTVTDESRNLSKTIEIKVG